MRRILSALAVTLAATTAAGAWQSPASTEVGASAFERYVDALRQQGGIPGISGVLIQDGVVVWERGLGFADVEERVRATPATPYAVADLTQTLSTVLLLQCVEQRHLNLDAPVQPYGVAVSDGSPTLRQVLSHTGPSAAGTGYYYDPARFAHLAAAVEYCAPQPFRKSVAHRLLDRLAMIDSVPGRDLRNPAVVPEGLFERDTLERYARTLERMAVPYRVDRRGRSARSEVPVDGINAAVGLVSTVRDLARFTIDLDSGLLLREDTLAAAWSPVRLPDGTAAPTGLGWFVQTYRGTQVVWHAGVLPDAYSSLIVKVPSRRATMILLANSDDLVVPAQFETGDVTRSLFASVFLRMLL